MTGAEKMTSSCTWGSLDLILVKNSSLKGLSGMGTGFLGSSGITISGSLEKASGCNSFFVNIGGA